MWPILRFFVVTESLKYVKEITKLTLSPTTSQGFHERMDVVDFPSIDKEENSKSKSIKALRVHSDKTPHLHSKYNHRYHLINVSHIGNMTVAR